MSAPDRPQHRIGDFRGCEAGLREAGLRQSLYDAGEIVMKDVLLTLHGEAHLRRRRLEMRVFRRDFFRYYELEVFPPTRERTLAPLIAAGRADLIDLGYRMTVNLTADFAGIDRPAQSIEETECLIRLVKKFSEGATMVHSTRDKAELEAEVAAALAEFQTRFLDASVARRQALLAQFGRGEIDEAALPRDILTVILRNEDALELSDAIVQREMAFYLQAGAHSTANATVHAFHEIVQWAGDDAARWERLNDPFLVQRAVHESLRLHPASPEAWRSATTPLDLPDGAQARPGERIVFDLFAGNRDAAIFGADFARFDPDRAPPPGCQPWGLSFGSGVHACLGRELDGGVPARDGADPATHQFGIVALLVIRLLELGARPDPDDPATPDPKTSRPNWGRYPVVFTRSHAHHV